MEIIPVETPENGDVYRASDGQHVGSIDVTDFDRTKNALHLQVMIGDVWFVYKLEGIEQIGEDNGVESVKG